MRVVALEPIAADRHCPKCDSCNSHPAHRHIMRVADERGLHYECNVCGQAWSEHTQARYVCHGCHRVRTVVRDAGLSGPLPCPACGHMMDEGNADALAGERC